MGMLINDGEKGKVIFCKYSAKNMQRLERLLKIKFGERSFSGKYSGTWEPYRHYFYKGQRGYVELMMFFDGPISPKRPISPII